MRGFNVLALNKNKEIASLLRYTNLQWTRKYYESGLFSMEIPLDQYSSDFKYIYTYERPEMGVITQVNYIANQNYKAVNLSGYFLENSLNSRVAYKKPTSTNITNSPAWVNQTGRAEDVAFAYFNGFKDVKFAYGGSNFNSLLNIRPATSQGRGHIADHERDDTQLGSKIYQILKPSKMSYRINYDFESNEMVFEVWSGKDRTQDNTSGNNPVILSTRYGNIKNPDILVDISEYKQSAIVTNSYTENNVENVVVQAICERLTTETEYDDLFTVVNASVNRNDYSTDADFKTALATTGHEELLKLKKTISIQFDALESSYEYMTDFDLGDVCSIEISDIGLSCDATLVGCYEVIKQGKNTLTLEFDTFESIQGGL